MKHDAVQDAFSLVEVVMALGICAFVLIAMMGLFVTGLKASRESEDQVQAANLASQILAARLAAPLGSDPNQAIPTNALTRAFSDAYDGQDRFVALDGRFTNSAAASYRVICRAGTNALTGTRMSQVYLMLSWPPQASVTNAYGKYETLTYIPLP